MYQKAYIQNLGKNGQVVSEKSKFLFSYVNDLGQEMTITFNTHIPSLTQLVVCICTIFRSKAAIVSEKSTVFTFFYRKAQVTKFDLAVK